VGGFHVALVTPLFYPGTTFPSFFSVGGWIHPFFFVRGPKDLSFFSCRESFALFDPAAFKFFLSDFLSSYCGRRSSATEGNAPPLRETFASPPSSCGFFLLLGRGSVPPFDAERSHWNFFPLPFIFAFPPLCGRPLIPSSPLFPFFWIEHIFFFFFDDSGRFFGAPPSFFPFSVAHRGPFTLGKLRFPKRSGLSWKNSSLSFPRLSERSGSCCLLRGIFFPKKQYPHLPPLSPFFFCPQSFFFIDEPLLPCVVVLFTGAPEIAHPP